jgi:hypothetical protein
MNDTDFNLFAWILFLPLLMLSGCDNGPLKPAPIGDHAGLEQLSEAYRNVAQQYPVQPASMRPAGRKKFVEEVFEKAGYSFSATLKAFASQGVDVSSQDHHDLAELLFLPHQGLAESELATLYSSDELVAIESIQSGLK